MDMLSHLLQHSVLCSSPARSGRQAGGREGGGGTAATLRAPRGAFRVTMTSCQVAERRRSERRIEYSRPGQPAATGGRGALSRRLNRVVYAAMKRWNATELQQLHIRRWHERWAQAPAAGLPGWRGPAVQLDHIEPFSLTDARAGAPALLSLANLRPLARPDNLGRPSCKLSRMHLAWPAAGSPPAAACPAARRPALRRSGRCVGGCCGGGAEPGAGLLASRVRPDDPTAFFPDAPNLRLACPLVDLPAPRPPPHPPAAGAGAGGGGGGGARGRGSCSSGTRRPAADDRR